MKTKDRLMLQESAAELLEKAKTIPDLRWRRYVLDEARRVMALDDVLESDLRLQNLIVVTEGILKTREGAKWLDGFLSGIQRTGEKE